MKKSIFKKLSTGTILVLIIGFSGSPIFAQHKSHCDKPNQKYKGESYKEETCHTNKYNKNRHQKNRHFRVKPNHCQEQYTHRDCSTRAYHNNTHKYYSHPRFGNVIVEFSVRPLVIKHYNGNFYYLQGHYYQHYPNVGYVRVNPPKSICFNSIPTSCEPVVYREGIYRMGDLSFIKTRKGFRLAAAF